MFFLTYYPSNRYNVTVSVLQVLINSQTHLLPVSFVVMDGCHRHHWKSSPRWTTSQRKGCPIYF